MHRYMTKVTRLPHGNKHAQTCFDCERSVGGRAASEEHDEKNVDGMILPSNL